MDSTESVALTIGMVVAFIAGAVLMYFTGSIDFAKYEESPSLCEPAQVERIGLDGDVFCSDGRVYAIKDCKEGK
jgi:hypothetical protein